MQTNIPSSNDLYIPENQCLPPSSLIKTKTWQRTHQSTPLYSLQSLRIILVYCRTMARINYTFILILAVIFISSNVEKSEAARHLLQNIPTIPGMPTIPSFPTIPNMPNLPIPSLPSLPNQQNMPTIPNIPGMPKVSMPPLPTLPRIPSIPGIPSLAPPPSK